MMRGRLNDMTGARFGRLVVLQRDGTKHQQATWDCACDCGERVIVCGASLRKGLTRSCGCLNREAARAPRRHGAARSGRISPELRSYYKMMERCYNPNHRHFANYGGRGIRVCARWYGDAAAFLEDMGEKPSYDQTLDRINSTLDYSPDNCRWASREQQNLNTRVARPVTRSDGKTFPSLAAGAASVGGSDSGVRKAILKAREYYGFYWSYLGVDAAELTKADAA